MHSRSVATRASRTAAAMASAPVLRNRTCSIQGIRWQSSGGHLFLQHRREGPDHAVLDRLDGSRGHLGVAVAQSDSAEAHDIVHELASLVVPDPAPGRAHHTGEQPGVVPAEENLGALAASRGEAGDVLGQCVCLPGAALVSRIKVSVTPAYQTSPDPADRRGARSSLRPHSRPAGRCVGSARAASGLPADRNPGLPGTDWPQPGGVIPTVRV